MESNITQSECNNVRRNTEENRKRAASGRLSPRTLFGNLKVKKSFLEEEAVSRNLNNSKISHGWKPPIKVDSNEVSNKFVNYDYQMETLNANNETNLSPIQNFNVNEPHYSGSNENLYPTFNGSDYHVESSETIPGNSEKTIVQNREFLNENNLMNDQGLDHSEDNICHGLDNYINNSENAVKQDSDGIQTEYRQDQEDGNSFQHLTEKSDFSCINHEYLKRNFQESKNLQQSSCSRYETSFENQNYDGNETLSQDTIELDRDNLGEYINTGTHNKDIDQEYSEKSDSSKSTLDLRDSKKFPIENNGEENKNVLSQAINRGNVNENTDREATEFFVTKGVDESFDTGVTNSQFLQIENQISTSSNGMNMTNSYNRRPLLNNIETMKRYCTSLTAQSEWQKNVLKCIIRDIDDLNKTIVNVTGVLKSLRKDNASAK